MDLLGVEQRAALITGGQRVAEKDRVREIADVLLLCGLNRSQRIGTAAGAANEAESNVARSVLEKLLILNEYSFSWRQTGPLELSRTRVVSRRAWFLQTWLCITLGVRWGTGGAWMGMGGGRLRG